MATKKTSPKTKRAVRQVSAPVVTTREKVETVRSNHMVRLLLILALIFLASWMMYSLY